MRGILLAVAIAVALLVPSYSASAATPTERKLMRQVATLTKQVRQLRTQMRTQNQRLERGVNLALNYSVCLVTVTADTFQGTWEIIDRHAAHAGQDFFPVTAPITDRFNSCAAMRVTRPQGRVPPDVSAFSALVAVFS